MWLPKDERKVLRFLYKKLSRDTIGGTVRLPSEEFIRCGFTEDRFVEILRFFSNVDLIILKSIISSSHIDLGFTSKGYKLGEKYSSKTGFSTLAIWVTEYLWLWVVLSVLISFIGIVTTIIIAIIKD